MPSCHLFEVANSQPTFTYINPRLDPNYQPRVRYDSDEPFPVHIKLNNELIDHIRETQKQHSRIYLQNMIKDKLASQIKQYHELNRKLDNQEQLPVSYEAIDEFLEKIKPCVSTNTLEDIIRTFDFHGEPVDSDQGGLFQGVFY